MRYNNIKYYTCQQGHCLFTFLVKITRDNSDLQAYNRKCTVSINFTECLRPRITVLKPAEDRISPVLILRLLRPLLRVK